jgi:hypothetical protein
MRDLDPAGGFQQAQKYYTNQNSDFSVKVSRLNNSSDASQNDSFVFSAAQYKFTTNRWKGCNYRVAPGMRLDLNASYFKTKIIEASALGKLSVMMFLKNTLEGLYFKSREVRK